MTESVAPIRNPIQCTVFCTNKSKAPWLAYISNTAFIENRLQFNKKYILKSNTTKSILISVLPVPFIQNGEILLSSVIMELLGIQHGNVVHISCMENQVESISEISIELSTLLNYPFPSVMLSQLEYSYPLSDIILSFYENCPLPPSFRFLIPLNNTFIQGDIISMIPENGVITSETQFRFSVKPKQELIATPVFNATITRIMKAITLTLNGQSPSIYTNIHGVVIYGTAGSGKTAILKEIVRQNKNCVMLSVHEFSTTDPVSFIESEFNTKLICFDDVSELSFTEDFIQLLQSCFTRRIIVVLATTSIETIPSYLLKEEYFNQQITCFAPTIDERSVVLNNLLHGYLQPEQIQHIAQYTSGYCYKDLNAVAKQMVMNSLHYDMNLDGTVVANPIKLTDNEITAILNDFTPSSLIGFDVRKSSMKLSNVGGYQAQKQQLYSLLSLVSKEPEQLKRFNLTPAAGILLYGPTGCGKSYIIPAVIGELNSYYIYVDSPSLFSKFFSETEANIRRIFAVARSVAPCIIVFDQLEILAGKRTINGADDGGFNERIVTTLLTELDGVDNANTGITVIGIASDMSQVDDAIIRPGRLGTHVYMGKPSQEDRIEILKVQTKEMPLDQDVSLEEVSKRLDGFSGAQLKLLCTDAAYAALNDKENVEQTIKQKHFIQALNSLSR